MPRTICRLDSANVWTGEVDELEAGEAAPIGWIIAAPPPRVPEGQAACWIKGKWEVTEPPIARLYAQRMAQFAAERWGRHQVMTFMGVRVACDDVAATRAGVAIQARAFAQAAGLEAADAVRGWKCAEPGVYLDLTLDQVRQLLLAGVSHVQACFDVERAKQAAAKAALDAGDYAALAAVDPLTGWPD